MSTTPPPLRRTSRLTLWLWIVFGLVLLLLASPFVIGSFLPSKSVGAHSGPIDAPAEEVWAAVQDFERFPISGGLALSVSPLEDRPEQPAWLEELETSTWTVITLEREPPRRIVRSVVDDEAQLECRWQIEVTPTPTGTLLRVEQECTVRARAPQLRFVMSLLHGAEMGPIAYFERIRAALEGEAELEGENGAGR